MSKTTDSISSTCVLCCQAIRIYAVGPCDHHICFKCSTKMRVLCDQKYCGVCRTDMPKVIFTHKLHPYQGIISHKFPVDRKHGIAFAINKAYEEYRRLQDQRCTSCPPRRLPENSFKDLQDHLRKEHELFYCELCLKHLQIFTNERKCYNRQDLAIHRRKGDKDDTSYRGHPLCEFCDERYFDADELLKHLRRQHYYCHFCETDGASNQYYDEYDDLKYHFMGEHFLCEEDQCSEEKFTHAFRSEIDLKAHKATAHSKNMTRAQVRQARQLDIEINLPPRPRDNRGYGGAGRGRGQKYGRYDRDDDTARAVEASMDSARKERHTRDEESGRNDRRKATTQISKEQKANSNVEGRRNSKQEGSSSGKTSPVPISKASSAPLKTNKMTKDDTKTTKMLKDDTKTTKMLKDDVKITKVTNEDDVKITKLSKDGEKTKQIKAKEVSVLNISGKLKNNAAEAVVSTHEKETTAKRNKDEKSLQNCPSLETFKPLANETVTPSWNDENSTVAASLNKGGAKKKKKNKDAITVAKEKPESEFDLYSAVKNINETQPLSSEQMQSPPMWVLNSGKHSTSGSQSQNVPSVHQKQPPSSWATNVPSGNQNQLANSVWPTNVSANISQPVTTSTRSANVSTRKKKQPGANPWAEKSSTPNLVNTGDFPTLSSIASLLGGNPTSKKKSKDIVNNQKIKKQSNEEDKPTKAKCKNKATEPEKSSSKEVVKDKSTKAKCKNIAPEPEKSSSKELVKNKSTKAKCKNIAPEPEKSSSKELVTDTSTKAKCKNIAPEPEKSSSKEVVKKEKYLDEQVTTQSTATASGLSASTRKKQPLSPPPGMASAPVNNITNRAPPGFTPSPQTQNFPPGFSTSVPLTDAPPYSLNDYIQPTNYNQRNLALLGLIKTFLDNDEAKLMIFKTVSRDFLRSTITPAEYYQHCLDLLGDNLPGIFSELVSLLPDVIKQQELLSAFNDHKVMKKPRKVEKVLKISEAKGENKGDRKVGSKTWGKSAEHSTCTQCGQVMLKADMERHLNSHQDFPSLTASVASTSKPFMSPTPWAKIK